MKKIFLLTLIAILATSCLPKDTQIPQSPLLPLLERKSGLIAYIGTDGNIYVTDQSGRSPFAVTDNAVIPESQASDFRYYQYPTWSADGKQVAFVSAEGAGGAQTSAGMFVYNVEDETTTKIFSSESEFPFYLYWSPDNDNVTFLSTSAAGRSLLLQSVPVGEGERVILDAGSPYYWSWAPDGNAMIVHMGSETSSTPEHLAFLQLDTGVIEDGLDSNPAPFQAPAWSPNGERILYTRVNEEAKNEIVVADSTGEFQQSLAVFEFNTAFAWSPDSELVAYIEGTQTLDAGVIGKLHVVDLASSEDFFQAEDIFAVFWSPNSRKLAYFRPLLAQATDPSGEQQLLLQLNMLDTVSGESKELFTFAPTNQFSSILPYFDQYHQSATIWSPDSNNLLLAFQDADGNPGIAVVAASGQLEPRLLAEGFVAFWSWK
jgi:Tol biopolymer transport system component